jgi:hypothetical protein
MCNLPTIIHTSLSVTDDIGTTAPDQSILPDDITELIQDYDISYHNIGFDENLFEINETLLPESPNVIHQEY